VQCERKPIEVSREKSSNCAASTEKIYIRKDLCSPLAATPTFVTDNETARYVNSTQKQLSLFPETKEIILKLIKMCAGLCQIDRSTGIGNVC